MVPELRFKFAFPGFGSVELEGHSNGNENTLNEVCIKFVPNTPCKNQNGWLIKLSRSGDCYVQEMKPLAVEEEFEGIGVA